MSSVSEHVAWTLGYAWRKFLEGDIRAAFAALWCAQYTMMLDERSKT